MAISGTYFDRLVINVLPWTSFAILLIYFATGDFNLFVFFTLTVVLWVLDILIILIKFHPKPLKIKQGLYLGKESVEIKEIASITPILDKRHKWSFRMLEFGLTNGEKIMVVDKPQFFISEMLNKPSNTLKKLFKEYPELKSNLRTLKSI